MTRPAPTRLLWPLLLLAASAAVGARLYDDWRRTPSGDQGAVASAGADAATPAAAVADATLALPPPQAFAVIAERPLFAQTRRPPPPPAPDGAPPAETAPAPETAIGDAPASEPPPPPPAVDFTLVGVVTTGSDRYAMVRRQSDGMIVEVPEGGDISGWFAVLIDPERAVFRQGGTEAELKLKFDAPVPPELVPAPRPRPAPNIAPAQQPAPAPDNGAAPQEPAPQ